MNRLSCIGNLCRDPESRVIKNRSGEDVTVCNFTVAANNGWGDRKTTEFVRVTVWGHLAETCEQYLQKGAKVYVAGVPSVNVYINNDGVACGNIELRLEEIEFLSKKDSLPYQPTEEKDEADIEDLL